MWEIDIYLNHFKYFLDPNIKTVKENRKISGDLIILLKNKCSVLPIIWLLRDYINFLVLLNADIEIDKDANVDIDSGIDVDLLPLETRMNKKIHELFK